MKDVTKANARKWLLRGVGGIFLVAGAGVAIPGAWLIALGGSAYYLTAGLALAVSGLLLARRKKGGARLFLAVCAATILWSGYEVGLDGWALVPRLSLFVALGLLLIIAWLLGAIAERRPRLRSAVLGGLIAFVVLAGLLLTTFDRPLEPLSKQDGLPTRPDNGEWKYVGGSDRSDRFSGLQQITPSNVSKLELAWTARLGNAETAFGVLEATPLMVGGLLYTCNTQSEIFALDLETGKTVWHFDPKLDQSATSIHVCRGVAYHSQPGVQGLCANRIVAFTLDARMVALDASTGRRCLGFGNNGEVSLLLGMEPIEKGYYTVTSAPTIVRGKVIVGGFVADGQHTNSPSGAIRAFDAITGKFAWVWDVERPNDHTLPMGQRFTLGTPNAWAPITGDEALGLAYIPLGAPTPDYVASHRTSEMNKYSNSVTALDVETGAPRWSFQITHRDVWDYDVASPATLVDFPIAGGTRPALIQPTKRGQFFVLDRRTGEPLVKTVERPVPQNPVAGETLSPTQPYSVGMPNFGGERLTEADMWGMSPFDQLWCRIKFRQARYDGDFTPLGLKPSIIYPGYLGGSEWAGVSVDPEKQLMVLNVNHFAMYNRLIPRAEADRLGIKPIKADAPGGGKSALQFAAQAGTPYAAEVLGFVSPLDVPCIKPPYSEIAAVDLKSRKIVWRQPLGTARDSGPFDIRFSLPIRMGVPAVGGPLVTRSGLIFIAATQERTVRALELGTGRLLWQARLPAGGHAAPMSYFSSRSGRQFIVIPSSGHWWMKSGQANELRAYALPKM